MLSGRQKCVYPILLKVKSAIFLNEVEAYLLIQKHLQCILLYENGKLQNRVCADSTSVHKELCSCACVCV